MHECPHCHWGFGSAALLRQHVAEKHELPIDIPIVTHYDPQPMPERGFDWTAVRDNYEPPAPIGYGRTEAEAIADLIMKEED